MYVNNSKQHHSIHVMLNFGHFSKFLSDLTENPHKHDHDLHAQIH